MEKPKVIIGSTCLRNVQKYANKDPAPNIPFSELNETKKTLREALWCLVLIGIIATVNYFNA